MTTAGKLLSVDVYPAGSAVAEIGTAGRLPVYEVWDFSPDGGTVKIDGVVYTYDGTDEDTSELLGALLPLPTPETLVLVEPYAETRLASVSLNDEGDQLQALVPHALSALLEEGTRDPDDLETVTVVQTSPGLWQVVDVLDRRAELTPDAGENLPPPDPSDGNPPAASPDLTALGGIGAVFLRWTAIENPDPVTYQLHVSTFPDYVADSTTLVTETPASSATVRTLPDGTPFLYDVDYYFQAIAYDADGAAPASPAVSAQLFRVTGPDIAVDYAYIGTVLAQQIIGGNIQADIGLFGTLRTAEAGARVELGPFGFVVYDSAGTPTTVLGSNGISTFKGSVQAFTLSVTNGMSIRGTANELAQAGTLTLAAGVSAAPNAPTVVADYEVAPTWKTSLGAAWPAGYEYKTLQRVGTDWVVGMRQTSNDEFVARQFNEDGSFDSWHGTGWTAQQIQRCAYVSSALPVYGFRQTDRRILAATHSVSGGAATNSLLWDFAAGQPAGTDPEGTVSYVSGWCRLSVTAAVGPASSLNSTATMSMRGRRLTAQVRTVGTFSQPGQRVELRMRHATGGEYLLARLDGENGNTQIRFQSYAGAGTTKTVIAARPSTHSWWRIVESNGDAKLQLSSDGVTWSNAATIVNHGLSHTMLDAMTLSIIVDDADGGTATTGEFDNVSVGAGFVDFGDNIAWLDTSNPPALGSDGTYILAAERGSDNRIRIYEIDPRSPGYIVNTYTSAASSDFAWVTPLVTVTKGTFDFGGTRFVVTTGNTGDPWSAVFTVSGTTLAYQRNESFYVPGQAGSGWDGTKFQTLATDGIRRKHTAITWTDVADWAKVWYAATTWYDGDLTGGTHETTPSPRAAFTLRKRQRYTVTSGDIPDLGGTDDPDRIRVYLASTVLGTLFRQATTAVGINSSVLATATFSGFAAPITNDFPDAIAARIINAAGTLEISGDGTIEGTVISAATAITSPLATFTSLIVTDRTFATVNATGLNPVPTALTDVPGMTYTVDVDSTGDIYLVFVSTDVDLVAAATGTFQARLLVDGVLQSRNVLGRSATGATVTRGTWTQHYLVTGLTAGNRIFKVQAQDVSGSGTAYRVNATHSAMTILQQQ